MPPLPRSPFGHLPADLIETWNRVRTWRSIAFLVAGSVWDLLTLTRIDRWSDQAFVLGYQLILVLTLVLDLRWRHAGYGPKWAKTYPNILRYISQFALGGLLSVYAIYSFRGASTLRAAAYASLLVLLLIANEFYLDRLRAPGVRLAVLAFALINGFVFAIPVWTGWLVPAWVAAIPALLVTAGVAWFAIPVERQLIRVGETMAPAVGMTLLVLFLIWSNMMPPLPLSLQRVGVFRDVASEDGDVVLTYEDAPGLFPWRYDRVLHWQPGEMAWCFTSVFAPRDMTIRVTHYWEVWDEETGWVTTDALPLDVVGGRAQGYRTYTHKRHMRPGQWRVRIEGPNERELGRVLFEVVEGAPVRELKTSRW